MIFAGYKYTHKSLDEFEFGQNMKTDYEIGVIERLNIQCLHFSSVAIDPIHSTRTYIISRMCSNLGHMGPQSTELSILERLKNIDL